MQESTPAPSRPLSPGARAAILFAGVVAIFLTVLILSAQTGSRTPREGSELLAAPSPLLPDALPGGYEVRPEPELALALHDEYRRRSVDVTSVEAASLPIGGSSASVLAATLGQSAGLASSEFRAGVLTGAAGGFGIDPGKNPFRPVYQQNVVVYTTSSEEGRLYVWFFREAFVQLFVPAEIAGEADEVRRVLLEAQLARAAPSLPAAE